MQRGIWCGGNIGNHGVGVGVVAAAVSGIIVRTAVDIVGGNMIVVSIVIDIAIAANVTIAIG